MGQLINSGYSILQLLSLSTTRYLKTQRYKLLYPSGQYSSLHSEAGCTCFWMFTSGKGNTTTQLEILSLSEFRVAERSTLYISTTSCLQFPMLGMNSFHWKFEHRKDQKVAFIKTSNSYTNTMTARKTFNSPATRQKRICKQPRG